jgi:hypothetical protein
MLHSNAIIETGKLTPEYRIRNLYRIYTST